MLRILVATCLVIAVFTSGAMAQTSNQGAFDKLSPGNQKIAQALFDAQQNSSSSTTTKPLSRDDIAAMKQNGTAKGWGGVFKEMKAQGLVQEKNLGQVVSKANHAARSGSSGTMITTGSGRTVVAGAKGKPEQAGVGENGNNQQPKFSGNHDNSTSGASAGRSGLGGSEGRGKH